jgi:hypothetical protein
MAASVRIIFYLLRQHGEVKHWRFEEGGFISETL